jgi:hypothetical protein
MLRVQMLGDVLAYFFVGLRFETLAHLPMFEPIGKDESQPCLNQEKLDVF